MTYVESRRSDIERMGSSILYKSGHAGERDEASSNTSMHYHCIDNIALTPKRIFDAGQG